MIVVGIQFLTRFLIINSVIPTTHVINIYSCCGYTIYYDDIPIALWIGADIDIWLIGHLNNQLIDQSLNIKKKFAFNYKWIVIKWPRKSIFKLRNFKVDYEKCIIYLDVCDRFMK